MATIFIQNCNTCEVSIPQKYGLKLYKDLSVRHPNAFYLKSQAKGNWDGIVHFINQRGIFKIGMLPRVVELCKSYGLKVKVIDERKPLPKVKKVITKTTNFKLRPEQIKAVQAVVFNKIEGNPFQIGVLDYAVGTGKCIGKDSLVYTNIGLLPISELIRTDGTFKRSFTVLASDGKYHQPSAGVFNKIRAIKITTERGYTQICGFDNHRYYTIKPDGTIGWVYAKTLRPGDAIPIYYPKTSITNDSCKDPELAYLLGCISGDGHVHYKGDNNITISLTGSDYEIANYVKPIWEKYAGSKVIIKPHRKFNGFKITKSSTKFTYLLVNKYPELIGLANDKCVPNNILIASDSVKLAYLSGLIDTDGHNESKTRSLTITSISYKNIIRVQQLLLSLGIITTVKPKKTLCNGKWGIAYRISIRSEEYDILRVKLICKVPRKIVASSKTPRSHYSRNRIPLPLANRILESFNNMPWKLKGKYKTLYGNTLYRQIKDPNRLTLEAFKDYCDFSKEFQEELDFCKKVYWDRIETIEILDEYPCYDICVPDVEHYIADGFIDHNTLIMTALYLTYKRQLRTLLITNDSDWLNQARSEFKEYLPDEDITFIQGTKKLDKWTNFNIGMVQTLSRNIKKFQNELTKIDMVLVDEADLGGSKSYQSVLTHLWNTRIRIGLSGTIYLSKFKKDQLKNWNLEAFFGPKLAEFKLADSTKKGYATPVVVKAINYKPYFGNWESDAVNYGDEYRDTIIENAESYKMIYDRVKFNQAYNRFPMLIVCKYIKHCENLYKYIQARNKEKLPIAYVHVDTPSKQRNKILSDFREGKIEILVSTTIIARGKNFPLLKSMINASGFKAEEKTIQFLGRLVRLHKSKSKAYLDDIQYPGHYLGKHSKARVRSYKKQGYKVIFIN